jgi:arsenate reductase
MAEGIARSLAAEGIEVWSAGSRPGRVHPDAITALREIGIDISHHDSKAVADIPAERVDTVVTLCAEEECPIFLGKARRLRWGLADPASAPEDQRLEAFRATRDALVSRIRALLGSKQGLGPME